MLDSLLAGRSDLWRGRELPAAARPGEPTGYPELDVLLPGGGWPRGGLIELLPAAPGGGALELMLPAVARLSARPGWVALVDSPLQPFAPGFAGHGVRIERLLWIRPRDAAECLWVLEQTLRSGECSIVIGWPGRAVAREAVRRLQLAAETGQGLGCLMLSSAAAGRASAAALRLKVHRRGRDLEVEVLKRRGGWALPPQRLSCGPAGGGRVPGDEKGRHGNSAAAACSGKATGA